MERYSPQYLGDVHYFSDHNFFVLFIYGVLAITSLFLFYFCLLGVLFLLPPPCIYNGELRLLFSTVDIGCIVLQCS